MPRSDCRRIWLVDSVKYDCSCSSSLRAVLKKLGEENILFAKWKICAKGWYRSAHCPLKLLIESIKLCIFGKSAQNINNLFPKVLSAYTEKCTIYTNRCEGVKIAP